MKQSNQTKKLEFNLRSRGPSSLLLVIVICTLGHAAHTALAQTCTDCAALQLEICPPPSDPWRVHEDFPVVHRWYNNWTGCGRSTVWDVVQAGLPDEQDIRIDMPGGLFYWTPSPPVVGNEVFDVTIEVATSEHDDDYDPKDPLQQAELTFKAIVDSNTMISPIWRDYLDEEDEISIMGRATGTPGGTGVPPGFFRSYNLEYGEVDLNEADAEPPGGWLILEWANPNEHVTVEELGLWDISQIPDGARYALRLTVNLLGFNPLPPTSVVLNQVIFDRSAMPGWPTRVDSAIPRSPAIVDIDDDGIDEVFVINRGTDNIYAWRIDGEELGEAPGLGATWSGAAVGDIDGDGKPEIVWTDFGPRLQAHQIGPGGTGLEVVDGFPEIGPTGILYRSTPTLADLNGDGALEMLVGARSGLGAQVLVYTYDPDYDPDAEPPEVPVQEYWTKTLDPAYTTIYASISVGDIDPDPGVEELIVVCAVGTPHGSGALTKAYAWDADGNTFPGWDSAGVILDITVEGTQSTGGGASIASAQPAIADLDGDGTVEIVIGPNVLTVGGVQIEDNGALDNATPSLSAAIGDLDGIPANLEFVLGERAYRYDGTDITELGSAFGFPKDIPLAPAVICKMGTAGMVVAASERAGLSSILPAVYAYGDDEELVDGFPKSLYGNTKDDGAPVIGDFDGDRSLDSAVSITDGSYGGVTALWTSDIEYEAEHNHWPMMGHNVRRTGCYSVPKPNRPSCVLHTPITGGVRLTWRDRSEVEEYYVIERSTSGDPWSFVVIADDLPADTESYDDVVLGANSYRIRAGRQDPTSGNEVVSAFAASGDHCNAGPILVACDDCPADLDDDNDVGAIDLAILLAATGPCIGCRADLNCDNIVNAADLAILLGAWGPC